eukprot:g3128.t1
MCLKESTISQDAKYCASLIQFQDFSARQNLKKLRLTSIGIFFRTCEVLPVAVGLSLWCLGGQLCTGFLVGVLLAITWEIIHPARIDDLKGYPRDSISFRLWNVAERGFECVLWPIYGTFAPLHLADPTCDHNEEEAMLDSLMLPAWCCLRCLYIFILWIWTLFNSQNFPKFPHFWSLQDLNDPRQWQLLIAWCWVISGALAAVAFPALCLRAHRRREKWADMDWKRFVRHEEDPWRTVQDVITMPSMYNFREYEGEARKLEMLEKEYLLGQQHVKEQKKATAWTLKHIQNILQEKGVTSPCTATLVWGLHGGPHESDLDLSTSVKGKSLNRDEHEVGRCKLDFISNAEHVETSPAANLSFHETGEFEINVNNHNNRDKADVPFKVILRKGGSDVAEYDAIWPKTRKPGQHLKATCPQLSLPVAQESDTLELLLRCLAKKAERKTLTFVVYGLQKMAVPFVGWNLGLLKEVAEMVLDAMPAGHPLALFLHSS